MRSHDHARVTEVVQQLLDAAAFAASISDCTLETAIEPKYAGYRFRDDDLAVRLAVDALDAHGAHAAARALGRRGRRERLQRARACPASTSRTG